jgi:hypothetical protein
MPGQAWFVVLALSIGFNTGLASALLMLALHAEPVTIVTVSGGASVAATTIALSIIQLMGGFRKEP